MKKIVLVLCILLCCCNNTDTKSNNVSENNYNGYLIQTANRCVVVKTKDVGRSIAANTEVFKDSYGNIYFISSGKISVYITNNHWNEAAISLKIALSDCGEIK